LRWLTATLFAVSLAAGLTAPPVQAEQPEQEQSLDAFIQSVEATYRDVESLGADFVQVTRSMAVGDGPEQKGTVLLARPQKMRWEFSGPEARMFITDGSQMWVYSPNEKQVHVYKELGAGGTGMESLLSNLDQLDELFDVEELDAEKNRDKNSVSLKLTPKKDANFKHLRLVVSKKKYLLEQVTIVDAFDNETELSFSQVKLNVTPDEGQFTFVPPAGVQVISPDGL